MKDCKTIVHIIAQLRMGAGRVVTDMAIEQGRNPENQIAVCVSTDADSNWRTDPSLVTELASRGIEVHTIGDFFHRKPELLHQSSAGLRKLMGGRQGPLIIHAHTAMAAAVGSWANPDLLVATCHGWGIGRPAEFDLQDSIAYRLCDSVLTYSKYWADRLRNDMAVASPVLISMGLDLSRLTKQREKSQAPRPLRIGTVCELIPRKGVDLLLQAMPAVWEEMADAELHIIGHGEMAASLRDFALLIDPESKRIFFHGALRNPTEQIAGFDMFVLASRSDNLPVVLLETMFAGIPIIATEVGGIPDLIMAAKCGLVISPESVSAISEGIVKLAGKETETLMKLGCNGTRFVQRRNDVRKTVHELDKLYRESFRKRKARSRFGMNSIG
jgi:glycosyltransferase involved in cell wall biosynthesis